MNVEQIEKFNEDGAYVIPDFLSSEEIQELRDECTCLLDKIDEVEQRTIFDTSGEKIYDYFMTSGDKIRYFYESDAFDGDGNLKKENHLSINKIGHALHALNPVFQKITFSNKIREVVKSLGLVDPVVSQSMYIFKQPHIGGAVNPHQDSTYLYTDPMSLLGLWIPLEDVTLDNGCLSFIPGSHKSGLHGNRRMIRNPDKESSTVNTGTESVYDNDKFKPILVEKGALVLIHGLVVHKSEKNLSDKSRHVYTFHLYDQHKSVYADSNWLQPTKELPFPQLFEDNSTK